MLNRLTASLDFQGQALTLRSERQRLLASNIANADTPGYIARDLDFASALKQATGARTAPRRWPRPLPATSPGQAHAPSRTCCIPAPARPTSTATASTWTASAPPSPTTA